MPARLKGSIIALSALALALSCPARAADGYLFDAAQAPTGASAPTSPASPTVREPQQSAFPDESALRYYASRNETQRVNAEIARLKRFYPNWLPPKDLYDTLASGEQDETVLWDCSLTTVWMTSRPPSPLARRPNRIARPSQDLQQKIRRKTARLKINDFLKQSRWQDIVDYVHDANTMADAEVDILWAVAEAFARTKQAPEAMRNLRVDPDQRQRSGERLATIQKAMAVLRMADVEPLIAMGVKPQDGSSEFAPIMVDITRARIAAYLHDERVQDVVDADMRLFENFARAAADPNQSALVGWYDYKHKDYRDALEWFKLSIAHGGDAMIAHGLAHTLRSLGYLREAEEVSYAWREPLVNNSILLIDILQTDLTREIPPYVEPDRLYRYAQESLRVASGKGAGARLVCLQHLPVRHGARLVRTRHRLGSERSDRLRLCPDSSPDTRPQGVFRRRQPLRRPVSQSHRADLPRQFLPSSDTMRASKPSAARRADACGRGDSCAQAVALRARGTRSIERVGHQAPQPVRNDPATGSGAQHRKGRFSRRGRSREQSSLFRF